MGHSSFLILGCGNMARALCVGMYQKKPELKFITYTPTKTKAIALAKDLKGSFLDSLNQLPNVDNIMIACKPQQFSGLAQEIKGRISSKTQVISIMAGLKVEKIQEMLAVKNILRVMPNTPNMVGEGVNALFFSEGFPREKRDDLEKIFSSFSTSFSFESEDEIDIITPFSGSGPAYFFKLTSLLTEKLYSLGVEKGIAQKLVEKTLLGSAKLLDQSEKDAGNLREEVTSKGGVTQRALEVFSDYKIEEMIDRAIDEALIRNQELGS